MWLDFSRYHTVATITDGVITYWCLSIVQHLPAVTITALAPFRPRGNTLQDLFADASTTRIGWYLEEPSNRPGWSDCGAAAFSTTVTFASDVIILNGFRKAAVSSLRASAGSILGMGSARTIFQGSTLGLRRLSTQASRYGVSADYAAADALSTYYSWESINLAAIMAGSDAAMSGWDIILGFASDRAYQRFLQACP